MADLEDKKVSQLESGTVTSNSVFLDSGNGVSTKVGSQDIANFVGKTHDYTGSGGLVTNAKTLVGAINEVAGSAGKSNLADMDDVNIDDQTLSGGQGLVYDDTNDEWVNGEVASALESLTDVDIDSTSLADGQAIVYDETNDKWVNGDVASGASANEALPYDENTSYSYGEYCTNLGYLWRCTAPNGATGTWDATKWIAVLVTDEYKRVRIMTKAQFDLLSNDEKDGFIYVSDYPTKIQDIDNVNLNTSDNNKLLGVSVSGSDISVGAVENTILTVHSKNVSIVFDSSGEGAVSDADIDHIIAVEDMMSDSGIYPAYIPYRTRGGAWRIKTLNRNNLNFSSAGLISSTRTVKIYYLA